MEQPGMRVRSSGSVTVKAAYGATVSTCRCRVVSQAYGDAKPMRTSNRSSPPAVGQTVSFSVQGRPWRENRSVLLDIKH